MGDAAKVSRRTVLGVVLALTSGGALFAAHPPLDVPLAAYLVAPLLVAALRAAGGGDPRQPRVAATRSAATLVAPLLAGAVGYGAVIAWLIAPAGAVGWGLLVLIQAAWLAGWAAVVLPWLHRPFGPLLAAVAWVGMDALRGLVPLSGFRWASLSHSQVDVAWLHPTARVLGASGVTLVVVLLSIALVDGLLRMRAGERDRPPRAPLGLAVGVTLAVTLTTVGPPPTQGTLDVLAVQGNDIEHWRAPDPEPARTITRNLHAATLAAIARDGAPDLTVWPESAVDRDPSRAAWQDLGVLASEAARASGTLVTGVSLDGPDDPRRERIVGAWQLGPAGTANVDDLYIKRRPVPFGEYVPARRFLDWIPALDQVPRDAIAGPTPQSFEVAPDVHAAVLICFETLFSDLARTNIRAGETDAGLILAITNDASFRRSAEPAQHLAQSRMLALETGRWVVHAALSGSSAFVDPDGRVFEATELFTVATIRREVPLAVGDTPFLATGDVTGIAGAVLLALLPGLELLRRGRRSRR